MTDIEAWPMVGMQQNCLDMPQGERKKINIPDAEVWLYSSLFSQREANALFDALKPEAGEIHWEQQQIQLYGKKHNIPRLTAWHGEPDKTYRYSGITVTASDWTPTLLTIKKAIEAVSEIAFNSVLLNLYQSGDDSVSWHGDDEKALGRHPVIGSVSLGATREFQMKHKTKVNEKQRPIKPASPIMLTHGSYLLMQGPTQHHWLHQIPKSKQPMGPRINLTFRVIEG